MEAGHRGAANLIARGGEKLHASGVASAAATEAKKNLQGDSAASAIQNALAYAKQGVGLSVENNAELIRNGLYGAGLVGTGYAMRGEGQTKAASLKAVLDALDMEKAAEPLTDKEIAQVGKGRDSYAVQAGLGGLGGNMVGQALHPAAKRLALRIPYIPREAAGRIAYSTRHGGTAGATIGAAGALYGALKHNDVLNKAKEKNLEGFDRALVAGGSPTGIIPAAVGSAMNPLIPHAGLAAAMSLPEGYLRAKEYDEAQRRVILNRYDK